MAADDTRGALQIAAKFSELGDHKEAITRAWQAIQTPDFYRQIGRDPAELVKTGVAAIRERYNI